MDEQFSFGGWLRQRRKGLDLTQEELARRVGCATVTLQKIELDERRPSREIAERLAAELQLPPDERPAFIRSARGELAVDQLQPAVPSAPGRPLPSGTVTFLFTDIAGSTQRWEARPDAMRSALARHDALLRAAITTHDGIVFKTVGDAFYAVFSTAPDALRAALAAQRALADEVWQGVEALRVRMALQTGTAELREGDYFGAVLNRTARLLAVGHGGQVLLAAATQELVRDQLPPETALRDLGAHHLPDVSRPEHLFQLVAPGLPADFSSLRTQGIRHNLSPQATSFIGREQDVGAIIALLRAPEGSRLLTLTGPGGTGKTRLALQVAAEVEGEYADGVWVVELAPLSDAALVPSAIAQVLGVTDSGGRLLLESLKTSLRQKHLLLILDNFEHVVAAAPVVSELLAAAPQIKALVTSQSLLHLYGERQVPVSPLEHPDLDRLPSLGELSTYPAVALFVQRACAVKPDFALTSANAPAVAGICAHLEGIPLAIELAAARVRIFPPQTLLARLHPEGTRRLATLTGGARDRPARQQSLRGTIDWSYQLLEPGEQTLFARLGVFAGGCTLEAAEEVCGEPDSVEGSVLDGLVSLADKSLVRQQEDPDGEPRFTMLETIREYALERLAASGEAASIRERHARYYLAWLEALIPSLREHRSVVEDQNVAEMSNLVATSRWIIGEGDLDLGVRWFEAGFWFFSTDTLEHSSQAWHRWHQAFIESREPLPVQARAKALTYLGRFAWYDHEFPQAAALLEEGLALTRTLDAPDALMEVLGYLGDVYRDQDLYAEATEIYEERLTLAQAHGMQEHNVMVYHGMGELALLQGDYPRALALAQTSRALIMPTGDRGIVYPTLIAGFAAVHVGDYELAAQLLTEGFSDARSSQNSFFVTTRLVGFGGLAASQGRPERAARLLGATEKFVDIADMGHVHRREYEWAIATARAGLDAAAWDAAWAEGRAMTLEQAIAYALSDET